MNARSTLRETLLAVGLLAFGLLCLPALIYLVGQAVVGEYEQGLAGLYEAIADRLAEGNRFAWILVVSPYLSVQLIRLWFRLRKPRRNVN